MTSHTLWLQVGEVEVFTGYVQHTARSPAAGKVSGRQRLKNLLARLHEGLVEIAVDLAIDPVLAMRVRSL